MLKLLSLAVFSVLLVFGSALSQEELTITTYYPSPYGVYNELRSRHLAVGATATENYFDSAAFPWDTDASCAAGEICNADLVVGGNVGIGTRQPADKIDVDGNARIRPNSVNALRITDALDPKNASGNVAIDLVKPNGTDAGARILFDGSSGTDLSSNLQFYTRTTGAAINPAAPAMTILNDGNVGIGTTDALPPTAKLDVRGGVRVGDDAVCNPTKAGTLRYNAGQIEYCNGAGFVGISSGPTMLSAVSVSPTCDTDNVTNSITFIPVTGLTITNNFPNSKIVVLAKIHWSSNSSGCSDPSDTKMFGSLLLDGVEVDANYKMGDYGKGTLLLISANSISAGSHTIAVRIKTANACHILTIAPDTCQLMVIVGAP